MIRSRAALAIAACIGGVAAGSIGAAQADTGATGATGATGSTGSTGAVATVTVNGAGTVNADSTASASALQADYMTALGAAMTDAHAKALALAGQAGDTLGAVQSITEQTNDGGDLCQVRVFNAAGAASGAPVPAVAPTTSRKKTGHTTKPKPKLKATVRFASTAVIVDPPTTTTACTIEADVTVAYSMAP